MHHVSSPGRLQGKGHYGRTTHELELNCSAIAGGCSLLFVGETVLGLTSKRESLRRLRLGHGVW